jgi:hypothetical protein
MAGPGAVTVKDAGSVAELVKVVTVTSYTPAGHGSGISIRIRVEVAETTLQT